MMMMTTTRIFFRSFKITMYGKQSASKKSTKHMGVEKKNMKTDH